jgi:peptide/nickel transport system substrate-binding protein
MKHLTKNLGGGRWRAAMECGRLQLPWRRGGQAFTIGLLVLMSLIGVGHTQGKPEGTMSWALHFSIAPAFFDPSETTGLATPFLFLYALHDALIKPLPQGLLTSCLAESWTENPDGLVYDFKLRQGVTFHNGNPLTAADVVFSFQRYKGAGKTVYQEKVATVEAIDAHRVRFQLREPWPDFLLFVGTPATGAGIVVPQKYLEQVGDDGFKRHPIGAGPYEEVRLKP